MAQASTATAPVMDVVAPPADNDKKNETSVPAHVESPEAPDPLDKLAAEDRRDQQARAKESAPPSDRPSHHAKTARQKDKSHASGVGMAVTATVIIVLGLAALATYAYIQTNS